MIYFITEKYLKTYTPFGNNVDISKIDYLTPDAYTLVIQRVLGTYFADWLLVKHQTVVAGTGTYTPQEEKLVDYVQKTMAWNVAYQGNATLSDYITNKGAQKGFGDYSNASSDNQVRFQSENYRKKYEEYESVLNSYLCKEKASFSEFTNVLNIDSSALASCNCCDSDNDRDLGMLFGDVSKRRYLNRFLE